MSRRVIVESYTGHMKRKLILWFTPIMILLASIAYSEIGHSYKEASPYIIGSIVWLGLLIYFRFLRKKR